MERKIMKRWVSALRSGKYKQGRRQLKTLDGKYCCLGVLCELAKKSKVIKTINYEIYKYPPAKVVKFAGMNSECGIFSKIKAKKSGVLKKDPQFDNCNSLAELNDNGATFKQIARFIEDNYEIL